MEARKISRGFREKNHGIFEKSRSSREKTPVFLKNSHIFFKLKIKQTSLILTAFRGQQINYSYRLFHYLLIDYFGYILMVIKICSLEAEKECLFKAL